MKRYLIPIIAIVAVGTATYFWSSHVSAHKALVRAHRAHLDSLRAIQAARLKVSTIALDVPPIQEMPLDTSQQDSEPSLNNVWAIKHLDAMPDSIRPSDFSERSVKYDFGDEGEANLYVDSVGKVDTLQSMIQQREYEFVKYSVMGMLTRHLQSKVETDEFSRCPSGYYFVIEGPDSASLLWKTGTVYFGAGCNDTAMCDFRFNYAKRLVEIKDIMAKRFRSLREYELAKFGQYAEERRASVVPEH